MMLKHTSEWRMRTYDTSQTYRNRKCRINTQQSHYGLMINSTLVNCRSVVLTLAAIDQHHRQTMERVPTCSLLEVPQTEGLTFLFNKPNQSPRQLASDCS